MIPAKPAQFTQRCLTSFSRLGALMRGLFDKSMLVLRRDGCLTFIKLTVYYLVRLHSRKERCAGSPAQYRQWMRRHETYDSELVQRELQHFAIEPKITVLVPVYGEVPVWLDECVRSVQNQYYTNWELIVCGRDLSTDGLLELQGRHTGDTRVKMKSMDGFAELSEETGGEYVLWLDCSDKLPPFALFEIVKTLHSKPESKLIYSDEDTLLEGGERVRPFFKPDWAPDLLLSFPYAEHLAVYRKDVLNKLDWQAIAFDRAVGYDVLLRFTERIKESEIVHIPKILYHRRAIQNASDNCNRTKAVEILTDTLRRRKISGTVTEGQTPCSFRVRRDIQRKPLVSIIIPTRDNVALLRACVDSIEGKSTYRNFEIIIIDNDSRDPKTLKFLQTISHRVVRFRGRFNYSRINNFGVGYAKGDHVCFLNNDTEVITPDWMEAMLEHAQRTEVGAVGCKLLYPSGHIQHAGVVLGLGPNPEARVAGHIFTQFNYEEPGYFGFIRMVRNCSAVTAAALLMRKSAFEKVGGFDETLAVSFNDVDLCLRLREKGYLVVYTPFAELYHKESASRGFHVDDAEVAFMEARWRIMEKEDPYYSPHLSLLDGNCRIRNG